MDTRTFIVVAMIAVMVSTIWIVRTKLPHLSPRQKAVATFTGLAVIAGLTVAGYFAS